MWSNASSIPPFMTFRFCVQDYLFRMPPPFLLVPLWFIFFFPLCPATPLFLFSSRHPSLPPFLSISIVAPSGIYFCVRSEVEIKLSIFFFNIVLTVLLDSLPSLCWNILGHLKAQVLAPFRSTEAVSMGKGPQNLYFIQNSLCKNLT